MKYFLAGLSKIKYQSLLLIILIISQVPGCLMLLLASGPTKEPSISVYEIEIKDKKIDYFSLAKDIGKQNSYKIGIFSPTGWWLGTCLLKDNAKESIAIYIGKHRSKIIIEVRYLPSIQMDKNEADENSNKILNEFKEIYLAEINKAEKSNGNK
jgi:hypothetical protein